jgi:magnesium chelatase family protein
MIAGELALDGRVRPVRGAIAMAMLAKELGFTAMICPAENAIEAAVVDGVDVYSASTLGEVVGLITGQLEAEPVPTPDIASLIESARPQIDFSDVRGQEAVKRAIVIAAAGSHNLLMLGPAGSGKTMMAKALPGVLPALSVDEALEITRIYSAAGALPGGRSLITERPVRSPHHTASSPAIVGGGVVPRAGEISLAHRGVLFLDELPEFNRNVLETLRQPMEDHIVSIARSHGTVRFPASFMLVAAMNPTPRGDVAPGATGQREMDKYLGRISGPLLDRVDIHIEAPAVPFDELSGKPRGTGTAAMRDAVAGARRRAESRQGPNLPNARLTGRQLDGFAAMDEGARALVGQAIQGLGLSARAYDKIRRVSRTIADLEEADTIEAGHVAEAVGYRLLDRR